MTDAEDPPPMRVRMAEAPADRGEAALVAVMVFQDQGPLTGAARELDEELDGAFSAAREAGDFRGRREDGALFYARSKGTGPRRILFLGAGKTEKADRELIRRVAGQAVRRAESLFLTSLHLAVPPLPEDQGGAEGAVQAGAEGLALAAWDFRELKSPKGPEDDPTPPAVSDGRVSLDGEGGPADLATAIARGAAFAEGAALARTLQSRPGNVATPTHLAEVALHLAGEHGFHVRILGPKEIAEERMEALLSVSRGSDQEPRLIVLEHRGGEEGSPPLALVGKGLTFDAGGISIKPASGMEDMKFDMSGGGAVLGAMKAIGILAPPVNVVAVVPSSENLLSGSANKPGDVVRTRSGKTVEIINTDAEGRLLLADALSFVVDHYAPAAVVDCATLTGASVVALGSHASAVLGTDEELVAELRGAGDRSGERCWPLPLWDAYRKQLESTVADLKNVGGRPAGAITAAVFLSEFVGEVPWAHLDIAGTAYGDPLAPYQRKGGFGVPTRLLLEWVWNRIP